MTTVVLVIHLEVSKNQDKRTYDFGMIQLFGKALVGWSAYAPLEDNAPIRINIASDGFTEI